MRLACHVAIGVAAACCLLACAAPITGEDLDAQLREAGRSVRGLAADFEIFPIEADSQLAAWTLAAESRDGEPLPITRQLSRRMERLAGKRTLLVVGSPYPALTRQIVLDALELSAGRSLAGLVLVYVGSSDSARDVRESATKLGARFVQRELQ